MKTFKTNKNYQTRSICDSDCIFNFNVIGRTENFITINSNFGIKKCKINICENAEYIYPLGKYSMCPILRAE
jgi:hypothetical protein